MGDEQLTYWRDKPLPGRPFTGEVKPSHLPGARLMRHEQLMSSYTSNEIVAYFDTEAHAQDAADALNALPWNGFVTFAVEAISAL